MILLFWFFSIIYCQNIVKNPSFEEIENNQVKDWKINEKVQLIPSEIHSGKKTLYWKPTNHSIFSYQVIPIEKGFQYEMCAHFKIKDMKNYTGEGFMFMIESVNKTNGTFEYFYSKRYFGSLNWKKACHITGIIKKANNDSDKYYFGLYSYAQKDNVGEIYVEDVSVRRINFRIGINNDRDEVSDNVNIVYQINGYKENYNLSSFELITRIKDNTKTYYDKKTDITSFFFTKSISTNKLKIEDNKFYQVESILKNKKDNVTDISSYPFKKINKIKRNVTLDEYGRMFINNELFFPFGIYLTARESDLMLINRTHLNCILAYGLLSKKTMDMVYTTQQGKIKVIYALNSLFNLDFNTCTNLNEEEDYKKFVDKVNEFKDHPNLLSWYINDEIPYCYNKYLRNRTLSIHELDPNHPSFTVLYLPGEVNPLMNTTDIMGLDTYPVNRQRIRDVNYYYSDTYKEMLEAKPFIPVIQIFDWACIRWKRGQLDYKSAPPSLQEMRSMSWQALAAGAKGLLLYSLYELLPMDEVSPVEERWKDVIKFTDEIWKYKDVILSIDKVNKIEYTNNYNVTFKQWKYNKANYIVIVNLEREKEIFKINLLDKYNVHKEFGLGSFKKKGTEIIFNLEPIDVIMIKYSKSSKSNAFVTFLIIFIIIIFIGVIIFFARKYLMNKYKTKNFVDSISKLMNDDN